MIAVQNDQGDLIKVLRPNNGTNYGIHSLFGLISETAAEKRIHSRKLKSFDYTKNEWLCRFSVTDSSNISLKASENCEVLKEDRSSKLVTPVGTFTFSANVDAPFTDILVDQKDSSKWLNKVTELALILMLIMIPVLLITETEAPIEEDEKVIDKITVKVVEPANTVRINAPAKDLKVKPLTKSQISKRAVKRNLGFLGMVGSKTLKDAVGGVPQNLEKATAGAGAGGDAGSGGEVLTGLGKGLKKTTVGNTGVAGLGGIGTKGAGGGKGGYGNTLAASGSGSGLSSIAVSSNSLTLEGGLSRYAINATIAKYLGQVRQCYEEHGLKYNPALEGLVTVNFEINGTGRLNHSRVKKTSLNNKKVEKCITTKMMGWQFPIPKGQTAVNVNYPFMLRPMGT